MKSWPDQITSHEDERISDEDDVISHRVRWSDVTSSCGVVWFGVRKFDQFTLLDLSTLFSPLCFALICPPLLSISISLSILHLYLLSLLVHSFLYHSLHFPQHLLTHPPLPYPILSSPLLGRGAE